MNKRDKTEELLRGGAYLSQIARSQGISEGVILQYLQTRVGEGVLRLSDIYYAWPADKRQILQDAATGKLPNEKLKPNDLSPGDLTLFKSLRQSSVFNGDMYEYVSTLEISLHALVRRILQDEFGDTEAGWWRKGIPTSVRIECVGRREADSEPVDDAFSYTNLIELSKIILSNWKLFGLILPQTYGSDRKQLERDLARLNRIRNTVMHPVKARKWSEEDFEFVRGLAREVGSI